ncbi:MAG: hypothetical protein K8F27_12420 [Sulfuricellaceae bacterium]|nr:hypothetical protein [Sulfuricellaceae bacterium]
MDFLDEIGRVSTLLNKGLSRVNNSAYAALAQRVGAAQARFGEQTVGAAIGPLLEKFERRFLFGAADYDGGTLVNRLVYIRWPFFLLIFSDSLSLSFFPNFVAQFYHPIGWLSREVVIGLPISVFMFVWALSLPISGQWSERVGHRRAFIVGALVTALGLILTATSQNMLELLM